MKALITGITGFVGSHLAEYLLSKDFEVHGTIRWRSNVDNIKHIIPKLKLHECDLTDPFAVNKLIEEIKPEYIFHLASQSYVYSSWISPSQTITNNVISELNLLEAVRKYSQNSKIQIACSSEEYGYVAPDEVPITESNPIRPLSPYAVSKVTQDFLAYQYFKSYGLHIIRTRAFNHSGPRRGEVFVISNFAKQIAEIEKGYREPIIKVGNLDAIRDFTDVRDVVIAYLLAVEKCEAGEVYNISSGNGIEIKNILKKLMEMSTKEIKIENDPLRMRPSDVNILLGDSTKFMQKTGWKPEIPIEKTLKDTLDYWRLKL